MDIPLFTIHDSVITTREHATIVGNTIRAVYESYLGAPPTLETAELEPRNPYWGMEEYVRKKLTEDYDFSGEGKKVRVPIRDIIDKLSDEYDPDSTFAGDIPDMVPFQLPLFSVSGEHTQERPNPFGAPPRKLKKARQPTDERIHGNDNVTN